MTGILVKTTNNESERCSSVERCWNHAFVKCSREIKVGGINLLYVYGDKIQLRALVISLAWLGF